MLNFSHSSHLLKTFLLLKKREKRGPLCAPFYISWQTLRPRSQFSTTYPTLQEARPQSSPALRKGHFTAQVISVWMTHLLFSLTHISWESEATSELLAQPSKRTAFRKVSHICFLNAPERSLPPTHIFLHNSCKWTMFELQYHSKSKPEGPVSCDILSHCLIKSWWWCRAALQSLTGSQTMRKTFRDMCASDTTKIYLLHQTCRRKVLLSKKPCPAFLLTYFYYSD